ncbi:MAG: S41 family peptidase [Treponema sp.]|nr:S41 family peptidase [Treponema sp.]
MYKYFKTCVFLFFFEPLLVSCAGMPRSGNRLVSFVPVQYRELDFSTENPVKNLSVAQMMQDIGTLEYVFKTGYVFYDRMEQEHIFDFEKAFARMRKECRESEEMTYGQFQIVIAKDLSGIPDRHIGFMRADGVYSNFTPRRYFFSTGIQVRKTDEGSLSAVNSIGTIVQTGWKVYASEKQLFPVYSSAGNEFLVGTLAVTKPDEIDVCVENSEGRKSIQKLTPREWYTTYMNSTYKIENGSQVFYRICSFEPYSENGQKDALEAFAQSGKDEQDKDIIVIDLRANTGGDCSYSLRFLSGLTNRCLYLPEGGKEQEEDYISCGYTTLFSPAVLQAEKYAMKAKYVPVSENCDSGMLDRIISYSREKPEKYFLISSQYSPEELVMPSSCNSFKGKIILIVNCWTASACDSFYRELRPYKNTIVVGENTQGLISSVDPLRYVLPNSKAVVVIPCGTSNWSREKDFEYDPEDGLLPDYWVENDVQLCETLRGFGVDEKLIAGIHTAPAR